MHERRVERVLIALPWMPCRRACALCPTACAPVCAPRSTNGPLLSRAGGCDKLRRCHRDDERIVLRLRVTVRVESARAAECALSVARQEMPKLEIWWCAKEEVLPGSAAFGLAYTCAHAWWVDDTTVVNAVVGWTATRPLLCNIVLCRAPRGRFRWELTRTGLSGMRQDIY